MLMIVGGIILAWLTYSFVTLPLGDALGGWTATLGKRYGELPVGPAVQPAGLPGPESEQLPVATRAWTVQGQPACAKIW